MAAQRRTRGRSTSTAPTMPPPEPPDDGPPDDEEEGNGPSNPFPFAALEDDPADAIVREANDHNRIDLRPFAPPPLGAAPPPPPLGADPFGMGGYAPPPNMGGRPTSPPIWNSAHLHESVSQLRVWKRVNGRPVLVGECDARLSYEDFIRKFFAVMPVPGEGEAVYLIRPLNFSGIEVGSETELPPISEHHTLLAAERSRRAAALMPGAPGYIPAPPAAPDLSPVTRMMERAQSVYEAQIRRLEEEAKAERERAAMLQDKVAEERAELAARTGRSVEAITERLMGQEAARSERMAATEAERNKMAQDSMGTLFQSVAQQQSQMFTQLQAVQQGAAEREREAYDRRLREEGDRRERENREAADRSERAEKDAEAKRLRDQQEWERKWEREKEENRRRDDQERGDRESRQKEADAERQRAHEARLEEMKLSVAREREHAERMMSLNTQREKGESVEGMVNKGIGLLEKIGLKPADLLDLIRPPAGEGPNPLIEIGAKAIGEGIKVAGEVFKDRARAQAQAAEVAAAQAGMGMGLPPGYGMMPYGAPGMMPGQPPMLTAGMPQQPFYPQGQVPGQMVPQGQPGVPPGYVLVQQAPGMPPVLMPAAQQQPGAVPPAGVAPDEKPAPNCSMPMPAQRAARNAIRALVRNIRSTPAEKWAEAVAVAVQNEMAIYGYCSQVTIRYALKEGGADDLLAEKMIAAIDASGLVPADLPRG